MKTSKSLKLFILEVFIVLAFLLVAVVSLNFYIRVRSATLGLSNRVVRGISSKLVDKVSSYLEDPAKQTRPVSNLLDTEQNIVEQRETLWKYMWEQLLILPQIQTFSIADEKGNYVQVRRNPQYATRYIDRTVNPPTETWLYRTKDYNILEKQVRTPEFDPRSHPWYNNTTTEKKIHWTDVYIFTTAQTPGISATYPLLNKNGNKIGVTAVNIPLKSLSNFLEENPVAENGMAFIINEKNTAGADSTSVQSQTSSTSGSKSISTIIAHPDYQKTMLAIPRGEGTFNITLNNVENMETQWTKDAVNNYLSDHRKLFMSSTNNRKYQVSVADFPMEFASNWKLFIVTPLTDVLGVTNNILFWTLIFSLIAMVIAMGLIYLLADTISSPLVQLTKMIQRIQSLDLDNFASVNSNLSEIHEMSSAVISAAEGLQTFKKYVPDELVKKRIATEGNFELEGKREDLTLFFSDIEGFTHLSERMQPEELMRHLSTYIENLSDIIMKNNGTIDKYIGDAILAFWGAPVPLDNAPYLACKSALLCQQQVQKLNTLWEQQDLPFLRTRIGIHTGPIIVGNTASENRQNYTLLGEGVNTASRLEGANKLYETNIIISEATHSLVSDYFLCRSLDVIELRGKSNFTKIFELLALKDSPEARELEPLVLPFNQAFSLYLQKNWSKSFEIFKKLYKQYPDDTLIQTYLQRCVTYAKNPSLIPENWNGVAKMFRRKGDRS